MKKRKTYGQEFKLEVLRQWGQGSRPVPWRRVWAFHALRCTIWKEQLSQQGEDTFQGSGRNPAGQPDADAIKRSWWI